METFGHRQLKQLALGYLRSRGAHAAAIEVGCPIARFRIDAAGYIDPPPRRHSEGTPAARTIIIECKQDRADFLRDNHDFPTLLARRRHLERVRQSIEQHRIPREEPELRRNGTSLFPELDDWDYHASRLPSYHRTLRLLERIDQKVHGETKFHLIARYRLADECYIAAPYGMIRPCELPPGWGLLDCSRQTLERDRRTVPDGEASMPVLRVRITAPIQIARPERRLRLLRNIAVAASYAAVPRGVTSPHPNQTAASPPPA